MIRAKDRFLDVATASCQSTQANTLQRLLELNSDSQFSRDMGLRPGMSVSEFQQRVPICDYEFFRPYIDRMQAGQHSALLGHRNKLLMYAITSGTTARSKLIPITEQFLKDYRRGWQHWGIAAHQDHPRMRYLRMVQISSNHNRWLAADGIPCGNISGLVTSMQKPIVRKLYVVPAAVAKIEDPVAKQYAVLRFALAEPLSGMFVTANPGTLLQLCKDANEHRERLIRDIHDGTLSTDAISPAVANVLQRSLSKQRGRAKQLESIVDRSGRLIASQCWPELQCLGVWSGGSAGAYLRQLRAEFGQVSVRDHGLHASEGRMTIPFSDETSAGVLEIETHFFEFVPVNEMESPAPVCLESHQLEVDHDYYILLTTSSGLYRYNIRDVVRCVGYFGATPLLEFLHKGSHISSITGEKITESQVVQAMQQATHHLGVSVHQFTLTPAWGDPPGYTLFLDTSGSITDDQSLNQLALTFDNELGSLNCEYREKRDTGRLAAIKVETLSAATWQVFKESRLTISGGSVEQYKHPCLMPDPGFNGLFRTAAKPRSG